MCQEKVNTTDTESDSCSEHEEYEEEDEDNSVIIRAKWSLDGCSTIDEIIERLKQQIEEYKKLKEDGWELRDKIDDDYGFIVQKTQAIRLTDEAPL